MIRSEANKMSPVKLETDFEVNKLCYDSRLVGRNDIFFAIKGYNTDGNYYLKNAIDNGAGAVFTDSIEQEPGANIYRVTNCRETMAVLSDVFYDHPSAKMNVIGVTGTNGKTTVTNLINHILEFADKRTGLIGTNKYVVNKKTLEATHTTPESIDLNGLLFMMQQENVEYVTMEVSSHSLALKRVYGIDFDTVIFTNLSPEHLDFHENMEGYYRTKKLLFDSLKRNNLKDHATRAVYDVDDEYGKRIVSDTAAQTISYGFNDADYKASNLSMNFEGMSFDINYSGDKNRTMKFESLLTGRFNVYNVLAAVAAVRTFEISFDLIISAIKSFPPVDGRFNIIKLRIGALAVIDYSHTPDSLLNALITIKQIMEQPGARKGKIICVFGCGGNRDRSKRPVMGDIAAAHSDYVFVTSDNPRSEEPLSIISEITSGIKTNNFTVEDDRKKAIEMAVERSKGGDVILVAGKGHESYQEIKGVKHHLSDREIVENYC